MSLYIPPASSGAVIIRTDYSASAEKWQKILLTTSEPIFLDGAEGPLSIDATFINDPAFDGASPLEIATADSESLPRVAVVADSVTFSRKKPVTFAAVDMRPDSPGRTFRFRVQELWLVVTNLVEGNLSFDELYDSAIDGVLPEDPSSPQYKGL